MCYADLFAFSLCRPLAPASLLSFFSHYLVADLRSQAEHVFRPAVSYVQLSVAVHAPAADPWGQDSSEHLAVLQQGARC